MERVYIPKGPPNPDSHKGKLTVEANPKFSSEGEQLKLAEAFNPRPKSAE